MHIRFRFKLPSSSASRFTFILAVCAAIITSGCRKGTSPKDVAGEFLNACGASNYEQAKTYGTEETDRLMEMLAGFDKMMEGKDSTHVSYEVISEKIEGDVATVFYKQAGSSAAPRSLKLIRQKGEWLVSMDKESFGTDADSFPIGGTSTE